ncbi:MAG: hypothetical protein HY579_11880 [Nitrospinae bacterium]|nr:hypothetical protein [Nitrospinota bacterium]
MGNLDNLIDTKVREKMTSLLQENSVRIIKVNLRFTTGNKKNTLERFEAIYDSHEKALRAIPRDLLSVERAARIKYRASMDEDRRIKVMFQIRSEAELLLSRLTKEFRGEYEKFGRLDKFDQRTAANRVWIQEAAERETLKLMETLKTELEKGRLPPGELSRMYDLEEPSLVDMQLIDPLQDINLYLDELSQGEVFRPVAEGIQEAIRICVAVLNKLERGEGASFVTPEARKESRVQIVKASLRIKDLALNVKSLLEQLRQSPESRNLEMTGRIWERIREIFKGQIDGDVVLSKVQPVYDILKVETR